MDHRVSPAVPLPTIPRSTDSYPIRASSLAGSSRVSLRLLKLPDLEVLELARAEIVIGRHSDADVRIPDPGVSRYHCRLYAEGQRWHLEDLSSLNGTLVNGKPVSSAELRTHDLITVGSCSFQIGLIGSEDRSDERSWSILRSIAARLPVEAREGIAVHPGSE